MLNLRNVIKYAGCNIALPLVPLLAGAQEQGQKPEQPNILFIAIDDLKPTLGCYGNNQLKTPNIDRLAQRGTVFLNSYCQMAVCGPSRASIMTGLYPDRTGVWNLKTKMRSVHPDILTMPQYFRQNGYITTSTGKVYDARCVDKDLDRPSWSIPPSENDILGSYNKSTGPATHQGYQGKTKSEILKFRKAGKKVGLTGKKLAKFIKKNVPFPVSQCFDLPDDAYPDGVTAIRGKNLIKKLSKMKQPFFLAIGFSRPHLPFTVPKKYWDMYPLDSIKTAEFEKKSENGPDIAYHNSGELRNGYADIPKIPASQWPEKLKKHFIRGYFASVSYADAQVGKVLDALKNSNAADNTIIVLWGDHGWHLGDHGLWCKHSNFEQATKSPLIIAAPGFPKGQLAITMASFIDVFPTLCRLSGLPVPRQLQGKSLLPALEKPDAVVSQYAISQYPRGKKVMGYSIRDKRWRYTEWQDKDYTAGGKCRKVIATELYDYQNDPDETINLADHKKYAPVIKRLAAALHFKYPAADIR
jgi:iduronate 2-sulfatase